MKIKNTLPISTARKNIFSIAEKIQKPGIYYTFTERGIPKAVMLSAKEFELMAGKKESASLSFGRILTDETKIGYERKKTKTLSNVFILRDESKAVYLLAGTGDLNHREEEYVKCLLYVELIEKYKYPFRIIELGRYVQIGRPERKRYTEADIIIKDKIGSAKIIFEVRSFRGYKKNMDQAVEDLFELAEVVDCDGNLEKLVYFSQAKNNGKVSKKISVIDYQKFNNFEAWKKAGRPISKKIPEYNNLA